MALIREIISEHKSLGQNELIRQIAQRLGYARASPRIRSHLESYLRAAARRRITSTENFEIFAATQKIQDYDREELTKTLFAAMGRGWIERDKAIRQAARYLGFRRTGRAIRQHFKSVITGAIRRKLLQYEGDFIRRN